MQSLRYTKENRARGGQVYSHWLKKGSMKNIVLAALLAVASYGALADYSSALPAANALMLRWDRLNEACRGGHGDDPATLTACKNREAIYPRVVNLGWCRGPNDAPGHLVDWVKCAVPAAVQAPKPEAKSQKKVDKVLYCNVLALIYTKAIYAKSLNLPPEQALNMASGQLFDNGAWHPNEVTPIATIKGVINQVYFDPVFKYVIDSPDLAHQISQTCLFGPPKPFEPLK